jgi:4-amino-4-deoxy-L-arabinose transferase-like glycosyltransferase
LAVFVAYFFAVNHFVSIVHQAQFGSEPMKSSNFAWLVRFPPIGNILSSFFYVFGYNIFMIRLLQTILYFLSGVVLYHLVAMFRPRIVAFFAAAFLVLSPGYFEYGHMAYMEPGLMFFILFSSYFFLRYLKDRNVLYGIASSFAVLLTFYYKDPGLFLFPIFWAVLIVWDFLPKGHRKIRKFFISHKIFIVTNLIVLASIFPWIILTKHYNLLQYSSLWNLSLLLSIKSWIYYPSVLYSQLTPLFSAFFVLAIIYAVMRKRDLLTAFSVVFIICWYVLFTSYMLYPRLIVPVMAFVAILSSQMLSGVVVFIKSRRMSVFAFGVVALFLLFCSLWSTYSNFENRYYPLDESYSYIAAHIPINSTVYLGESIYHEFYLKKYAVKQQVVRYDDFLAERPERNILSFHKTLTAAGVDYFLFVSSADVVPDFLDFGMLKETEKDSMHFAVEREFSMGNNTITLMRVID